MSHFEVLRLNRLVNTLKPIVDEEAISQVLQALSILADERAQAATGNNIQAWETMSANLFLLSEQGYRKDFTKA